MNAALRIALAPLVIALVNPAPAARAATAPPAAVDPARLGIGWTMEAMDLDVRVDPARRRLTVRGTMRVRLDSLPASYGPTLYVNARMTDEGAPVMAFRRVSAKGAKVETPAALRESLFHVAHVRFPEAMARGARIAVDFEVASRGYGSQLVVAPSAALASWTSGWHPFTNPASRDDLAFTAAILGAPGTTTLHLPATWVGLVDGELAERRAHDGETVEAWRTPGGVARSILAGPYEVSTQQTGARPIRIYFLPGEKKIGRDRLARLVADAMRAIEAKLGPFPFPSYTVAEIPEDLPGQTFYAASQQTFITAKAPAFQYEHGNLPLWAHEMSHGWWGNTVGTTGDGAKWCGESLAQLGALIAIEALDGPESLREFLDFSRSGYSPNQCGAGYFALVRRGEDLPIATMGDGPGTHTLADSKGVWIYHMLRCRIGDEAFFAVLRGILRDRAGRQIDADFVRERFMEAAPEHDLGPFFSQWLDRTGAPVLDVAWHSSLGGDRLVLHVTQTQEGDPFAFDLEVAVVDAEGTTSVDTLRVDGREAWREVETKARPMSVTIDPRRRVLLWRPEYGPAPGAPEPPGRPVPPDVRDAVVGWYRFRGIERKVEVFERDGDLYVHPAGGHATRLRYDGDGTFHVDTSFGPWQQIFDLSRSPAPSFISREGPRDYVADRLKKGED